MHSSLSKLTKYIFLAIACFTVSFVTLGNEISRAQSTPQDNRSAIYQGRSYYDKYDTLTCNPVALNTSVYALGDSYLVGMKDIGNFVNKLTDAGYTNPVLNGVVGRSVNSGGGNGESALQAVDTDKNAITTAGSIVIVLGTNPDGNNYIDAIPTLMNKIREVNKNALVYWVNTGNSASNVSANVVPTNKNIEKFSETYNYKVIDWNSVYKSNSNYDGGLHPTPAGYLALTDLVLKDMGKPTVAQSSEASLTETGADANPNEITTWKYFISKGLTPVQVAGIMGNLKAESGFDPEIVNSSSGAYGLAQWLGGRKENLLKLENYSTLPVQLDYLWKELNGSYKRVVLDKILASNDISEVVEIFLKHFEIPCKTTNLECWQEEMDKRLPFARAYLKKYGGIDVSESGTCAQSGVGAAGENGWNIEDMVYYSQYDSKYAEHRYGTRSYDATIKICGCGPTSMAMVAATLNDNKAITPITTADYFMSAGIANACGTNWEWDIAAKEYGLKLTTISSGDFVKVKEILQSGGLVIASFGDERFGTKFTSGRHIMVIRQVSEDGKLFYIADPIGPKATSEQNTTGYTKEILMERSGDGGAINAMWGFTK